MCLSLQFQKSDFGNLSGSVSILHSQILYNVLREYSNTMASKPNTSSCIGRYRDLSRFNLYIMDEISVTML
jgi:hypothetical protein